MNEFNAEVLANADARDAIDIARSNVGPVVWLTGNSYMPPLREFGHAETVWQAQYDVDIEISDLWLAYAETFESALSAADVLLAAPDYDNALYVVDLQRYTYRDAADDADDLNDEWEAV